MTHRYLRKFFFYLLIVTIKSVSASSQQLETDINNTLRKYNQNISVGIVAYSLTNDRVLYAKNPDQPFMPASILKILTATAALSFLKPTYQFQTKVLGKTSVIDREQINSDIYFYFDGDPYLTDQNLSNLVKQLQISGIKTIQGNIYIDDTIFDSANLGGGWVWDDLNYCYAAPISAAMINKNCLPIQLTAAKKSGQLALLSKNANHVSIVNEVISKNYNDNSCAFKLYASGNNNYYLSGCLKTNTHPINLSIAIRNVRLYAKKLLTEYLQLHGIICTGSIEFKKLPTDIPLYLLAEHKSANLSEMVKFMLKKSDNTIADTIYKKIGHLFFNSQATWQNSAAAVKSILAGKNNNTYSGIRMDDGSGLSRYNLITPMHLISTLKYAYNNEEIKQIFINSLPNAGIDGTLGNRMPNLKNRLYAKTGNMENSASLAGYIKTNNQEMLAFAIIINSFLDSPKKYHQLQDNICNILANYK